MLHQSQIHQITYQIPVLLQTFLLMNEEKLGKKPEDEEMPPLVDITDEGYCVNCTRKKKPEENLHCNGFSLQFSM